MIERGAGQLGVFELGFDDADEFFDHFGDLAAHSVRISYFFHRLSYRFRSPLRVSREILWGWGKLYGLQDESLNGFLSKKVRRQLSDSSTST